MRDPEAIVLGAGPAGLGAALALARAGARVVLVNAGAEPGGLCVTRRHNGFAYDIGGHIPFVHDEARRAWLEELLGSSLRWVDRPVSCVRDGTITRGRYLDQRPSAPAVPAERDGSARGELAHRVGGPFVDAVMRPYLEKVNGVSLERIPAERARRLLEDQAAPDGFHFPARGIGQLMDAMAQAAREAGARVRLETAVRAIAVGERGLESVTLESAGRRERIAVGEAVVAMPAGAASRLLDPAPPASITRPVRMRAVCIVYVEVARDRLSPEPWIQIDDPRVPFARMFEPVNWSPELAPPRRTVVGMECYCQADADDPVWGLGDAALTRACIASLTDPLGLLDDPAAASALEVLRLPGAYPLPDVNQVPSAMAPGRWIAELGGMHLAPGSAVIEAIAAGEGAAARILR